MSRKIAFLDHTVILSGGERSLLEIFRAFPWKDYEPILVSPCHGPLTEEAAKLGVRTEIIPMPRTLLGRRRWEIGLGSAGSDLFRLLSVVLRLRAFLSRERPSLLVTNSQKAHFMGALACFLTATPLCWYFRDILPLRLRRLILLLGLLPQRIVAISRAVGEQFEVAGRIWAKVSVIPNAVNLSRMTELVSRREVLDEFGLSPKSRLVGTVGQIARWKGQRYFIEAARQVTGRLTDVHFLIVGDVLFREADYKEELTQLVRDAGLTERIIFTGYREDSLSLMKALDILVHAPVEPEPFGRVIAEAMALGKPVIASHSGAAREIVLDGKTGILVPSGNAQALAEVLERLLQNPQAAREMGERGRERAEALFSMDRLIRDLVVLFGSVSRRR